MVQLYSFFNSSTSYRVRIALALKGVEYQYTGVNIRIGEQASGSYAEMNPSKGVPCFVDEDGNRFSQSLAIIQYLDDRYPQSPLLPKDQSARARVMELSSAIACDMHPVNNLRVLNYLSNNLGVSDQQKSEWYTHWINEGFTAVEALLERYGSGKYCFGDQPTLADCCLVPQVANAERMGCDLSAFPNVLDVYQFCQQQPAFQKAAPKAQPDFIG